MALVYLYTKLYQKQEYRLIIYNTTYPVNQQQVKQ